MDMPRRRHPINLRLRAALTRDGRPDCEIAKAAEVHPNTLSGWVNDRIQPKRANAQRLAEELKTTSDKLFRRFSD